MEWDDETRLMPLQVQEQLVAETRSVGPAHPRIRPRATTKLPPPSPEPAIPELRVDDFQDEETFLLIRPSAIAQLSDIELEYYVIGPSEESQLSVPGS